MTTRAAEAVAEILLAARETRTPVPPIRERHAEGGIDDAYAAQKVNTGGMLAAGRRLVGRKIGLTSLSVQRQLARAHAPLGGQGHLREGRN